MHRLEKNILHHAKKQREQRQAELKQAELKQWKQYYEEGSKEDYENELIFDNEDISWSFSEVIDKLKEDNIIN